MVPVSLPRRLEELSALLGTMCDVVAGALQHATTALVDGRPRLAERVIAEDRRVDDLRSRVEQLAVEVLALQAPVAGDLRRVVTAVRAAGEVERMGDLAKHVAEAARRQRPGMALPHEIRTNLAAMGRIGVSLALKVGEVARTSNVLLAMELDTDDDAMDALHRHMFTVLLDPLWPYGVGMAVDVTLLARYYERFADHAVVVARDTVYAVTGQTPESLSL